MKGQSAVNFSGSSRVHIAFAVKDLQRSRRFYETLLDVPPSKEKQGYIKFEPQSPSVNLTLNEAAEHQAAAHPVSHFGIQVKSVEAVQAAIARLVAAGLETAVEENTTCCYAVQDKVWVTDPDGNRWEVFVVLEADANERKTEPTECCDASACC